jgi:hypothetical protein
MSAKPLLLLGALLLAACGLTPRSNWYLMDEGYSLDSTKAGEFAMEVHLNQLKQLGGEINSPRFRHFVADRLKWHELCPSGWEFLPCIEDGSCVQRTGRSVTVAGRCAAP